MKNTISINGVLSKLDNSEITEKEYDNIFDSILETLESKGYYFGGGTELSNNNDK